MITLKNVTTLTGQEQTVEIPSDQKISLSAKGLILLPALIDPHVHFRTPGFEYKEDWETGAQAALQGGITTVFDMPNTMPPTITLERIKEKQARIQDQLAHVKIPLHYGLYLGADKHHFEEIARAKGQIIALKVFMGASTGDLMIDDESSLHAIFSLAASHDLLLAVHAEDEALIQERKCLPFEGPRAHSQIRNREVALRATKTALKLARIYRTRLYILHCSTKEEITLIEKAKQEGVQVFVETTPHHLFFTEQDYEGLGTKIQVNPPIRTTEDQAALWDAIRRGIVDTIGSDHAPHLLSEKALPYPQSPSGIPGIETTLPLLLNASCEGKLSLPRIISLMRERILEIFRLQGNNDYVLVDLHKKKTIQEDLLKTKCGWSPYAGWSLQGWPVYTILNGDIYAL